MNSGGSSTGTPDGPDGTRGSRLVGVFKLLYPGVGVKRWLLVGAAGVCVWSIGAAFMLRKLFALPFPDFLPSYYEGILLLAVGIVVVSLAVYGLYRSIGPLVLVPNAMDGLASTIYTRRSRAGGPRVVAIGGGTGLSVLLRGLKAHTDNLTAVITVADDGGSSGRLRKELGVLPPGDFRNCLVALSEAEPLLTELFQYRFDQGNGLTGHSFGNLFLVAMSNVTHSFDRALLESSRVLAVHGQIMPATVADLSLSAILKDGSCVDGESDITQRGGDIDRLFIDPPDAQAYPMAVDAIEQAQIVVIGPGSLYTSVLPNLMVPGISRAIESARATKIYVCNVAMQRGETMGYTVADHLEALQRHTFAEAVDYVLADQRRSWGPQGIEADYVVHDGEPLRHAKLMQLDLADPDNRGRHDPDKLAEAILNVYRGQPKSNQVSISPLK